MKYVGLRTKFLLIISVILLSVFGSITVYLVKNSTQSLRGNLLREAKAFSSLATTPIGDTFVVYKDSGTYNIQEKVQEFAALDPTIINISVVDQTGKILFTRDSKNSPHVSADQASTFDPIYQNNDQGALSQVIYPYFDASHVHSYSLVYTVSSAQIDQQVAHQALTVTMLSLFALLLTAGFTYVFIDHFILSPIHKVSEQAAAISAGNLEQQITTQGQDEIGALGTSLNSMANSLKANITKLQDLDKMKSEFMMITSHNLRTPLTIINGYIENTSMLTTVAEFKVALERIAASSKRLGTFAEDVLTISRFELGDTDIKQEDSDITTLLKEIAGTFATSAKLQELKFSYESDAKQRLVHISSAHIRSAIWNLLDNAAKFTPKGGQVDLSLHDDGQNVLIKVSDTGIGIKASELPKLFTKFHRGTSTLTYDYEGTGIGLYASKIIVVRHGGNITVESEEGKGSTFTISLPLAAHTPETEIAKSA